MLHTKYEGSRAYGFRQEDFFMFLYLLKHVTPMVGSFLANWYNLNKLGRSRLGDATYQYQGSRPYGFRQEDFLMISLFKRM